MLKLGLEYFAQFSKERLKNLKFDRKCDFFVAGLTLKLRQ